MSAASPARIVPMCIVACGGAQKGSAPMVDSQEKSQSNPTGMAATPASSRHTGKSARREGAAAVAGIAVAGLGATADFT